MWRDGWCSEAYFYKTRHVLCLLAWIVLSSRVSLHYKPRFCSVGVTHQLHPAAGLILQPVAQIGVLGIDTNIDGTAEPSGPATAHRRRTKKQSASTLRGQKTEDREKPRGHERYEGVE